MTLPVLLYHIVLLGLLKAVLGNLIHTAPDPSTVANSNDLASSDGGPSGSLAASIAETDFHQQHEEGNPTSMHWNTDYLWSPQIETDGYDDVVPMKRAAQKYIRLGRSRSNAYMRLGRGGDKGFIRFGRSGGGRPTGRDNVGRRLDNGFLRFGRGGNEDFVSLSGSATTNDDGMRFGRRGDKFIRFGRSQQKAGGSKASSSYRNDIDADSSKTYDEIGAKAARSGFIRLGRSRADNNFIRLGKKSDDEVNVGRWQAVPLTIPEFLKNAVIRQENDDGAINLAEADAFDSFIQKPNELQRPFDNDSSNEK